MKKLTLFACLTAIILISSCADPQSIEKCVSDDPYGFLRGLWHGIIIIFSLIGSIFSDDITIYAVHNTGFWYDLGFVIGTGSTIGGAAKATSK